MSSGQRVVISATALLIGVLAGVFSLLSWTRAEQLAGVLSALAGVTGIGVAIWATMAGGSKQTIRAVSTGKATATGGGSANTGVIVGGAATSTGEVSAQQTGDAEADGGDANSGVHLH